jgi:bifunctional DNA-binding transcriptional regulator/antitoxin component of YhaV-PrlF toxin-antitoxin module
MTVTLKERQPLIVPPSVQRKAGIKPGDRLEFTISAGKITITHVERTYKPTKAEWAAIRKGEAEIARGESVSLTELLHDVDRNRRKVSAKKSGKAPR